MKRVSVEFSKIFILVKSSKTWNNYFEITFMFSAQSLLVGNGSSVTYLRKIPWANQSIECSDVCNAAHGSEFLALMTSLLQRVRPIRDSTSKGPSLSSNSSSKRFHFLDDRCEKISVFLLEKLIIDNSSSACGKMISCIEARKGCSRAPSSPFLQKSTMKHSLSLV